MAHHFAIIILGYRRLYSLQRLLKSLLEAALVVEKNEPFELVISFDEGSDEGAIRFCKNFFSQHFNIKVVVHESKLGPDKHNLWAMEQSESQGAVLILEDDLMVSPSLFYYALNALHFYRNDDQIAGIGLYNFERNLVCNYPFHKLQDGSDSYYYQKATSWGLLVTNTQWQGFKNFKQNLNEIDLPSVYSHWSDEVWEKKFNAYLIQEKKYFVHPHISLTTNFGELGVHVNKKIYRHAFQSLIQQGVQQSFHFLELNKSKAVYDAYGEPVKVSGFKEGEITCDILGARNLSKVKTKYILTSRHCKESIEGYALDLVPPELNVSHHLRGVDLVVSEVQFVRENYYQRQKRLLKLHYYFYPDKGILHLLRLKMIEIINRLLD